MKLPEDIRRNLAECILHGYWFEIGPSDASDLARYMGFLEARVKELEEQLAQRDAVAIERGHR